MTHPFQKRILKEFRALQKNELPGITHIENNDQLSEFQFDMKINQPQHIYEGKQFRLIVKITNGYPVDPPMVKFLIVPNYCVPQHPHIYTNGHICLNLLGSDWTPACSIESVLLSIQSMLTTNNKLEIPVDNDSYVKSAPDFASRTGFVYHDNNV